MNIEPLEPRIAPASLTFTDVDGDNVVITTTGAGTLTLGANVIVNFGQLEKLDLTDAAFQNANVSILAARDPVSGGDGRVNVGDIDASGRDLGKLRVDGDLGQLTAGSGSNPTKGLVSLKAASLGRLGTGTGATALNIFVTGRLGALNVAGDVVDSYIVADTLGSVTIGGSLIGATYGGRIASDGDMGKVKIGGDLIGGSADGTGTIRSHGALAGVTIGGSILGGAHPGTGSIELTSGAIVADGKLGPVKVAHDVRGNSRTIFGELSGAIVSSTEIVSVTIGGSLIGGIAEKSGIITTPGQCGPVTIKGDIVGEGTASGVLNGTLGIASVTVGGSLIGGEGSDAGSIGTSGQCGPVTIKGDVLGGIGADGGTIIGSLGIASVTIGGSLIGGLSANTGLISTSGRCGPVVIGGDVAGGIGFNAAATLGGAILGTQGVTSVTIGGSLIGGSKASDRGVILSSAGALGPVKIGGNIEGGEADLTGRIFGETSIARVALGGSLLGGNGDDGGRIHSNGSIGAVKIGRDVVGGDGLRTGLLDAATALGAVTIAGSIIAGTGNFSGQVDSGGTLASITLGGSLVGDASRRDFGGAAGNTGQILSDGAMGPVRIGGDVIGGVLAGRSGRIVSMSTIASVTIGGSLIGGESSFTGEILSAGAMGPVKIDGNILGGNSAGFGQTTESGYIEAQRLESLFVGGSIRAGVDRFASDLLVKNASVRAVDDIGPIVIKGSLLGSAHADGDSADGDFTFATISARGQAGVGADAKTDVAIKSIKVGGRVELAQILAGYDTGLAEKNADAQIGRIKIGGDVIASSIVAGLAAPALLFGTIDDVKASGAGVKDNLDADGAVSKIASIVIKGSVFGTAATNDTATFAIAAQRLGSLKVGGTIIPLTPGPSNDPIGLATKLGATKGATTDGFDFHAFEV